MKDGFLLMILGACLTFQVQASDFIRGDDSEIQYSEDFLDEGNQGEFSHEDVFISKNAAANFICKSQLVPSGWAATGKATKAGCGPVTNGFNAYNVVQLIPGGQYAVCGSTQFPPSGWIIVGKSIGDKCGTQSSTFYVNQVLEYAYPGNQYVACIDSPVPPGFSVVSTKTMARCDPYAMPNVIVIQ